MKLSLLVLATACALIDGGAMGQTSGAWTTPSPEEVNAIYPEVEAFYLDLHRNPEISLHEVETAAKLASRVKAMGYDLTTGVGGTGIVAILPNGHGPTLLPPTHMDPFPPPAKPA